MERQYRRGGLAVVLLAIVAAAAVGFFAYNAGVAHGIASTGQQITAPGPGAFAPYGWYRPWGFGFFFAPFFFFVLFIFVMRGLFWGGPWRRYGCGGTGYHGAPLTFDEWHRRAHDRMTKEPAGSPRDDDRSRG